MTTYQVQDRLLAGEPVTGVFWPADAQDDTQLDVGGFLTWSQEGAELTLLGDTREWPGIDAPHFTVHGHPEDTSGIYFSLLDCWVSRSSMDRRTRRISASTLATGGSTIQLTDTWPQANYRTAGIQKWMPVTGLSHDRPDEDEHSGATRMTWRRPETQEVELPDCRLRIWPSRETTHGPYRSEWSIRSSLTFGITPMEPQTLETLHARFGAPLTAWTAFACDEPDDLIFESVFDRNTGRRAEIWRAGSTVPARFFDRPDARRLFGADDLPDLAAALTRWFELWEATVPGLSFFTEAIQSGNSFTVARFLALYTAAESYWKGTQGKKQWSIDALQELSGVSEETTGCSSRARALIGASRTYNAHGQLPAGKPGREDRVPTATEIIEELYNSTRRLHALVQACLLRELGLDVATRTELLHKHYRRWPLPLAALQ